MQSEVFFVQRSEVCAGDVLIVDTDVSGQRRDGFLLGGLLEPSFAEELRACAARLSTTFAGHASHSLVRVPLGTARATSLNAGSAFKGVVFAAPPPLALAESNACMNGLTETQLRETYASALRAAWRLCPGARYTLPLLGDVAEHFAREDVVDVVARAIVASVGFRQAEVYVTARSTSENEVLFVRSLAARVRELATRIPFFSPLPDDDERSLLAQAATDIGGDIARLTKLSSRARRSSTRRNAWTSSWALVALRKFPTVYTWTIIAA